jgi:hypothetical protein
MSCKEGRFLEDVSKHVLTVISDSGNNRHLRFKQPNSSAYGFDLVTWPGHLCITGDCGTYVFSRLEDMFEFFRKPEYLLGKAGLHTNPYYWGQKALSHDTTMPIKKYCSDTLTQVLRDQCCGWSFDSEDEQSYVQAEVEALIGELGGDKGDDFYAADSFKSEYGHVFTDLWDEDCEEYTFRYMWCLYGIAYGIGVYDDFKKQQAEKARTRYCYA